VGQTLFGFFKFFTRQIEHLARGLRIGLNDVTPPAG
jgi:hypothetical protein